MRVMRAARYAAQRRVRRHIFAPMQALRGAGARGAKAHIIITPNGCQIRHDAAYAATPADASFASAAFRLRHTPPLPPPLFRMFRQAFRRRRFCRCRAVRRRRCLYFFSCRFFHAIISPDCRRRARLMPSFFAVELPCYAATLPLPLFASFAAATLFATLCRRDAAATLTPVFCAEFSG